jgi:hypothetical protein
MPHTDSSVDCMHACAVAHHLEELPLVDPNEPAWEDTTEPQEAVQEPSTLSAVQIAAIDRAQALVRFQRVPGADLDGGKLVQRCPAWHGVPPLSDGPSSREPILSWACTALLAKGK